VIIPKLHNRSGHYKPAQNILWHKP